MKGLNLEEHTPDGIRKPIGVVISTDTIIGRDPGKGLKIDRGSISRSHGVFFIAGSSWCYKDLGSTNGSWHNGRPLLKDQVCVVRHGDKIQLADTFVSISESAQEVAAMRGWEDGGSQPNNLLLFQQGKTIGVYKANKVGRIIDGGGPESIVPLVGYTGDAPRFTIDFNNGHLTLSVWDLAAGEQGAYVVMLNGEKVSGESKLRDRDQINCADYFLIVDAPIASSKVPSADFTTDYAIDTSTVSAAPSSQRATTIIPKGVIFEDDSPVTHSRESSGARRRTHSSLSKFGQMEHLTNQDDYERMDSVLRPQLRAGSGSGLPPSARRFTGGPLPGVPQPNSFKDKLYALIGFFVLIFMLFSLAWYVFAPSNKAQSDIKQPGSNQLQKQQDLSDGALEQ